MKKLLYIFTLLSITLNAQLINIKVLDYSTNLSIDDADIYFKKSTKNYVSDLEGKAIVNLKDVGPTDELIVSKKDYQNARVKMSNLKKDITIKLEKISKVDLQETIIKNYNAEDILRKVIDNYEKNFDVDKYYLLVNVKQKVSEGKENHDYIDADLQLKFDKGKLEIKSKGEENIRNKKGRVLHDVRIVTANYLKNLYLINQLKIMQEDILQKKLTSTKVVNTKYANKPMFEVYLNKTANQGRYLLIDRKSFSVVEYKSTIQNDKSEDLKVNKNEISIKFRPYSDSWILKESNVLMDNYFKDDSSQNIILDYKLSTYNFSIISFPEFNKSVNAKKDIRQHFK